MCSLKFSLKKKGLLSGQKSNFTLISWFEVSIILHILKFQTPNWYEVQMWDLTPQWLFFLTSKKGQRSVHVTCHLQGKTIPLLLRVF